MSFVNPISSSGGSSTQSNTGLNQLDNSQTFLNLLVTQLKNQDPDNPTDPTQFMTEIAQLTAVQSQTTLNADEETVAADSMLGKEVTGTPLSGVPETGVVAGVIIQSSGAPELVLGGGLGTLSLSQVQAVYAPQTSTSTTSTTSTKSSTNTGSGSTSK